MSPLTPPLPSDGRRLTGRLLRSAAAVALTVVTMVPESASAQWFGFGRNRCSACEAPAPVYQAAYAPSYQTAYADGCNSCATSQVAYAAPVSYAQTACAPVVQQTACVAVQPVQETVYQQVPVTKYRKVAKTERRGVYKTAYEERDVTVMKTAYEQRTVDVPYTTYQQVTEYRQQTRDNSYWQTVYRPNAKVATCRVDCRPGMAGWWARTRNDLRNAFTPDRVATRQYVPNVQTAMVPVTRQIPITASRQMTYTVAKMVPTTEKRRVAVQKLEYEDVPVTAWEPYTETQTVAVGTRTQFAYVGAGGQTATASAPTPARTAAGTKPIKKKPGQQASKDPFADGVKLNSLSPANRNQSTDPHSFDGIRPEGFEVPRRGQERLDLTQSNGGFRSDDPRLVGFRIRREGSTSGWAMRATPKVLQVAGWKPIRRDSSQPALNIASND